MDREFSQSRSSFRSISRIGLAGGTYGFVTFLLPRLWIGIAYLKGDGAQTDESFREFWEFAIVSIAYLPAIVASIALPRSVNWVVLLMVAGATQWLTFPLHDAQPWMGLVQLWALPATLLLLLGAWISFRSWRQDTKAASGDLDSLVSHSYHKSSDCPAENPASG